MLGDIRCRGVLKNLFERVCMLSRAFPLLRTPLFLPLLVHENRKKKKEYGAYEAKT